MAKNIEMNILTSTGSYEVLYPKTLGLLIDGKVSSSIQADSATNLTGTITANKVTSGTFGSTSGEYIFPSNIRLKNSSNYGMKLNFGDNDYVYLYEDTDDKLTIKAKRIELTTTETPGITNNGIGLPKITYGTSDLIAGSSNLETGTFYFVYK